MVAVMVHRLTQTLTLSSPVWPLWRDFIVFYSSQADRTHHRHVVSCQLVIFLGCLKRSKKYGEKLIEGFAWKGSHLPSNSHPFSVFFPPKFQPSHKPLQIEQKSDIDIPRMWAPEPSFMSPLVLDTTLVQTGVFCPAKPVCWTSWFWNPFHPR